MVAPKPPPPPKKDARRHPRFELLASVEVKQGEETLILPARNISLGGLYLSRDGNDLSSFSAGMRIEVLLFDPMDEGKPALRATARVVRTDEMGMALMWSALAPEVSSRIASLLDGLGS